MLYAIERVAASRRRNFFTRDDIVRSFLKKNDLKRKELAELEKLDRRLQEIAPETDDDHPLPSIYMTRELDRLRGRAGYYLRSLKDEYAPIMRRFANHHVESEGRRWFEIQYSQRSFLDMWKNDVAKHYEAVGLTLGDVQVIIDNAYAAGTENVADVWRKSMKQIIERRSA
ncbi:MAG: hypothetical protein OEV62_03320 [Actinomycetota bacterium]|nr:hypothetical protein [Actinomycetota bacterium]